MRFLASVSVLTFAVLATAGEARSAGSAPAINGKPACDIDVSYAVPMPDQKTYAVAFLSNNGISRDVYLDLYAGQNKYAATLATVSFHPMLPRSNPAPTTEPGHKFEPGPYYQGLPTSYQFRSQAFFVSLPQADTLLRVVTEPVEGATPSTASCTPQFANTFYYTKAKMGESYSLSDDQLRSEDDLIRYFRAGAKTISASMVGTASCRAPYRDAEAIKAVTPAYPGMAAQQNAVGTVLVQLGLDAQGVVSDAVILRSSGNDLLDGAALDAARKSIYRPEIFHCEQFPGNFVFHADFEIDQS